MAASYLDGILAAHREAAKADRRSFDDLLDQASAASARAASADAASGEGRRSFGAALVADPDHLAVIAEVKRRSPSKGDLAPALDPGLLTKGYAEGGAAAISVLTDADFFGGSAADLAAARNACDRPVLRKDFTVGPADVCDAVLMGADAVLLIVAALDQAELDDLSALTRTLGLATLVECHDEGEVDRALAAGATIVGVNQRDLFTFAVDHGRAERLRPSIPAGVVAVAESGVSGPESADRLAGAGYDAVLVGEWLVTAADPAGAVAALRRPRPCG